MKQSRIILIFFSLSNEFLRTDDISGSELWTLPPDSPLALSPLLAVSVPYTRPSDHVTMGDGDPEPKFPYVLQLS